MKTTKTYLIIAFSVLFCSICSTSKSQQTNNKQLLVAGKDVVKPKVRISKGALTFREWNINKDTLELISVDNFLAFPFGSFKKINDLQARFKGLKYKEVVDSHDPKGTTKLNMFFVGNSYIKFIFLKDVFSDIKRFQVVSANIHDKDIILSNKIYVEMTKDNFFSMLIGNSINCNISEINVVKLTWEALGVWHYYHFTGNTLKSIDIDTDYILDKD